MIQRRYVWPLLVAGMAEASAAIEPPRSVQGQSCTAAATMAEATAEAGGVGAISESCTAAATMGHADIASPALVDIQTDSDDCVPLVSSMDEATASGSVTAVSAEPCTAAATMAEATVLGEDWAVICDDMLDLRTDFAAALAVVRGPTDPMRYDIARDVRAKELARRSKGTGYVIHAGAVLGRNGATVRPLQAGDPFAGVAARRAREDDIFVHVWLEGTGIFSVAGVTDQSYGATVYAASSNTFSLVEGGTAIGRVQTRLTGTRAEVWFQSVGRRSV